MRSSAIRRIECSQVGESVRGWTLPIGSYRESAATGDRSGGGRGAVEECGRGWRLEGRSRGVCGGEGVAVGGAQQREAWGGESLAWKINACFVIAV